MTRGASRMILLALLATSAVHGGYPLEPERHEPAATNGTVTLLDKIRRQLMADNYDYMESETEAPFPARHELDAAITTAPPPAIESSAVPLHPRVNDIFIPRTAPLSDYSAGLEPLADGRGERGVLKNDLLYYVDDERLRNAEREVDNIPPDDDGPASSEATPTTPKVSYKVLKVAGAGGGRRWAGGGYKFLQEERGGAGGGVALINLGDQPFPEFRLPSARRHLRAGSHSEPELELAQLTDLSGDLGPPF